MTISAIIPFYNSESTLARAIDSVLVQTILPSEIILVDNNSNDGSRLIADKYILEFPLLFTLLTESRQGANDATHETEFMEICKQNGIYGLKGHRSVGGFRASTYNALPIESVQFLVKLMQQFETSKK